MARHREILITISSSDGCWYYAICDLAEQDQDIYKDTSSFEITKMICEHALNKWNAA